MRVLYLPLGVPAIILHGTLYLDCRCHGCPLLAQDGDEQPHCALFGGDEAAGADHAEGVLLCVRDGKRVA